MRRIFDEFAVSNDGQAGGKGERASSKSYYAQ